MARGPVAISGTNLFPDSTLLTFLQQSVGYALTDDTSERCMWVFHGMGKNGKSTFLDAVACVLGDYASTAAASALMVKKHGDGRRDDIAMLRGARFVMCAETEEGERLAEALLKSVTGDTDKVTARLLYANLVTFRPTFKVFLATNHKPQVVGTDEAVWDRIRLVPFLVRLQPDQVDRGLPAKLRAEASGILNWALDGHRQWRKHGLQIPEIVARATAEYRREMDRLGAFLEDEVEDTGLPGQRIRSSVLYEAYTAWCERNGLRYPMSQTKFSTSLKERGLQKHDTNIGFVWLGLTLRRPVEPPF